MSDLLGNLIIPFFIVLFGVAFLFVVKFVASRYKKVPPGKAGVFTGRKGFKVITGGGRILLPVVEQYDEMMTTAFQVEIDEAGIPNKDNVKIGVEGVATCKLSMAEEDLKRAAQAFLGKTQQDIKDFIQNILKGHLRSIIGKMDIEELLRNRDKFNEEVLTESSNEMKRLGVEIITLVIQDIRDEYGYIDALGKKAISETMRDAAIKVAEAERDKSIQVSNAEREAALVAASNAAKVAEANKDRDVKVAEMAVITETANARAEKAKAIQTAEQDKILKVKEAERDAAEREAQVMVQEKEALRMQKELEATVIRQAEAERERMKITAEGSKQKQLIEAEATAEAAKKKAAGEREAEILRGEGKAKATQVTMTAEAEGTKAKLLAEADGTRAQRLATAEGEKAQLLASAEGRKQQLLAEAAGKMADAEATQKLAEALKELDERGWTVLLLKAAPELLEKGGDAASKVMEAMFKSAAAPFGSIDKITITDLGGEGKALSQFGNVVPDFVLNLLTKLSTKGVDLKGLLSKAGVDIDELMKLVGKDEPKEE